MYANETASLRPPHQYTPWVTINGEVGTHEHMNTSPNSWTLYGGVSSEVPY